MHFDVIRGDIAEQRADALVNAAGTSLQMGSGVAGALRRNAGGPIHEAAVSKDTTTSLCSPDSASAASVIAPANASPGEELVTRSVSG